MSAMKTLDNYDMLSSSLVGVIRQSLNAPFRKECCLLLGVTNNMYAKEVIYSLLKSRGSKAISNTEDKDKHSSQSGMSGSSCSPRVFLERQEKLESISLRLTDNKSITQTLSLPEVFTDTDNQNVLKLPVETTIQETKLDMAEGDSDEETQLDWETENL